MSHGISAVSRRTALAGVAAMFGAQLFAPIARAAGLAPALTPGMQPPEISSGPPSSPVFTAEERAFLSALSDRIIPETDTPGAVEAGVPDYIEKLLADWARPAERDAFRQGLGLLRQATLQKLGDAPLPHATPEQLDAVLTDAMEGRVGEDDRPFTHLRQLVVSGYYSSEVGIMQEREYLPVPGEYDGDYPYANITKVFSS